MRPTGYVEPMRCPTAVALAGLAVLTAGCAPTEDRVADTSSVSVSSEQPTTTSSSTPNTVVPLPDSRVDRVGTRNNIVTQLAAAGVEVDVACVDIALAGYTDAELSAMDAVLASGASTSQSDELLESLFSCVI